MFPLRFVIGGANRNKGPSAVRIFDIFKLSILFPYLTDVNSHPQMTAAARDRYAACKQQPLLVAAGLIATGGRIQPAPDGKITIDSIWPTC
jgi:hypothetical protein